MIAKRHFGEPQADFIKTTSIHETVRAPYPRLPGIDKPVRSLHTMLLFGFADIGASRFKVEAGTSGNTDTTYSYLDFLQL
jgi:hypothetical protein